MQVSVQRRLNRGLLAGLAYTRASGWGWTGYNQDVLAADPTGALNKLQFWSPTGNNRQHNLVVNYSYQIPNALPDTPLAKWLLGDWQVAGVTKFLTGAPIQPACTTTTSGIANTNPTLTPGATASCVYTGQGVFDVTRDPNLPEEDQLHFNPRAFAMPQPLSATVGNFGNVRDGILRQPSFWNWDVTLSRRFPVPAMGRNAQVRLQLQLYNILNTPEFTNISTALQFADDPNVPGVDNNLLTSTNAGRYVTSNNAGTNPPRQFGVTLRLEF